MQPSGVDETKFSANTPEEYVKGLAVLKAEDIAARNKDSFVLGVDTIVVLPSELPAESEEVLGKPETAAHAEQMLSKLSNRTHVVMSAFCLLGPARATCITRVVKTEVTFRTLLKDEITNYVATGEPMDKAGSYAVQGIGGMFITSIQGSYTSVVGLPLAEVMESLTLAGIWNPRMLGKNHGG